LKQNFLSPKNEEILEIDKMHKLNSLPSLLYRVHLVHTKCKPLAKNGYVCFAHPPPWARKLVQEKSIQVGKWIHNENKFVEKYLKMKK